jgi:hypothetical protein
VVALLEQEKDHPARILFISCKKKVTCPGSVEY